jgi:hypothetical protein
MLAGPPRSERLMEAVIRNGATNVAESQLNLPDAGSMPDLGGAVGWLNSAPLDRKSPRGKVVMIDFWTYSCINVCARCSSNCDSSAETENVFDEFFRFATENGIQLQRAPVASTGVE